MVLSNKRPNQLGAGNGAVDLLFHIGRFERAVPDHERSAS